MLLWWLATTFVVLCNHVTGPQDVHGSTRLTQITLTVNQVERTQVMAVSFQHMRLSI
jgi:hypothetical protein